jgi:mRNA interferase RelE/StbE
VSYQVRFTRSAKRSLIEDLPEKVATAAWNFIVGALRENPPLVGKQLKPPLFPLYSARRGEYRVIYRIVEDLVVIDIVTVAHRAAIPPLSA